MRRSQVGKRVSIALESVAIGAEGFGDWLAKKMITKPTETTGPLKIIVNGKSGVSEKPQDLVNEIKRVILNEKSLSGLDFSVELISAKDILGHLAFDGDMLEGSNRVKVVADGFAKSVDYLKKLYDRLGRYDKFLQTHHKKLKATSEDQLENALERVVWDIEDNGDPLKGLTFPFKVLGNNTIKYDKGVKADQESIDRAKIKPLNREECVELAKLIVKHVPDYVSLQKLSPVWLDYLDGDEIWEKLERVNESNYFRYIELTYDQNLGELYTEAFNHYHLMEAMVRIVKWINGSIKTSGPR